MTQFDRLLGFFPAAMAGVQVSYTCDSLARELARAIDVRVLCHATIKGFSAPRVHPVVPGWLTRYGYRYLHRPLRLQERLEQKFEKEVKSSDLAWIWPTDRKRVAEWCKDNAIPYAVEMINSPERLAKTFLDRQFGMISLPPRHRITERTIADEEEVLFAADLIFSPHPETDKWLLDAGIPQSRIITSSFGWDPSIKNGCESKTKNRSRSGVDVLFVGTLCVRKGTHLLVQAWNAARVDGVLRLFGWDSNDFTGEREHLIAGARVHRHGPVRPATVARLMREADIFAFPTIEEGGPQVTYEAAAHGLAIITTPMGAGRAVRHGKEAIVIGAEDHDRWVYWLRKLASDRDLRLSLGQAARERSRQFKWSEVARRRVEMLHATQMAGGTKVGS